MREFSIISVRRDCLSSCSLGKRPDRLSLRPSLSLYLSIFCPSVYLPTYVLLDAREFPLPLDGVKCPFDYKAMVTEGRIPPLKTV